MGLTVVPETDGVKLMKGFTIQLGGKKNRYGANVNERTSHIQCDWLIKNNIYTIFNNWDTPTKYSKP